MSRPEPRPYVASRQLGQAPDEQWRPLMPEANAAGELLIDMNVAHLRIGDASILIDLGFGDPTPDLLYRHPRFEPTPDVVSVLASLGVRPDDVTHVVITHAHDDHFEAATVERDGRCVVRYPNARYLLGRLDWRGNPNREQPDSTLARHLGTIARLGQLDLVDGDREIVPG